MIMSLRVFEKQSLVTKGRFAASLPLAITCQERGSRRCGSYSPLRGHLKVCLLRENDVPNELRRMLRLMAPSPDVED
jgi:predicted MarR family transcription regulator